MAKFSVQIPASVEASVREKIERQLQSEDLLKEVGLIARRSIVASIVAGKEPTTGANFENPNITPEWQQRKRRLSTVNKAFDSSAGGGSSKARLIFTGQFLESITNRIETLNGRKVIAVRPMGTHQPYKNLDGTRSGKPMPNERLGQYLIEQGRNWKGFPPKTKAQLVVAVRNYLRRQLTISKP